MIHPLLLLAQIDLNPTLPEGQPSKIFGLGVRDVLLILGVGLALTLVLFLWAYLTRKDRYKHSSQIRYSRVITRADKHAAQPADGRTKVRRKRRRHPDHLPRNPTLGETGGLPPLRTDEPSEPAK